MTESCHFYHEASEFFKQDGCLLCEPHRNAIASQSAFFKRSTETISEALRKKSLPSRVYFHNFLTYSSVANKTNISKWGHRLLVMLLLQLKQEVLMLRKIFFVKQTLVMF